jgi:hypothetical protein
MSQKIVDLSGLGGVICPVLLTKGGTPRNLLHASAGIARRVLAIGAEPDDQFAGLDVLRELIPDATPEEIDGLSLQQMTALLELVQAPLAALQKYAAEELKALDPNGARPATTVPA